MRIDNCKNNNCKRWSSLWAMSSQLLKNRKVIYDEDESKIIKMYSGVPQGGVLSPIFFNLALDFILTHNNSIISNLIKEGKILAYADDLIITALPEEKHNISILIRHLDLNGLKRNPNKCYYIWHWEDEEISKLGVYKSSMNYLGVSISYDKKNIIESIKVKSKKNTAKIKTFWIQMSPLQQSTIMSWFYRSLLLYNCGAAIATKEITIKDLYSIINSTERWLRQIPALVSTATVQALVPFESTITWILRIIFKNITKLSQHYIGDEMIAYLPNHDFSSKLSYWCLWKYGCKIDSKRISKILDPKTFRMVAQISRNRFYEIDRDKEFVYICRWGFVWNKNHRLFWTHLKCNQLRLFSIEWHEVYYDNGFKVEDYLTDITLFKHQLKELQSVKRQDKDRIKYDQRISCDINYSNTKDWIKKKFHSLIELEGATPKFGEEYQIFENVLVNLDGDDFTLQKLIDRIPSLIEFPNHDKFFTYSNNDQQGIVGNIKNTSQRALSI